MLCKILAIPSPVLILSPCEVGSSRKEGRLQHNLPFSWPRMHRTPQHLPQLVATPEMLLSYGGAKSNWGLCRRWRDRPTTDKSSTRPIPDKDTLAKSPSSPDKNQGPDAWLRGWHLQRQEPGKKHELISWWEPSGVNGPRSMLGSELEPGRQGQDPGWTWEPRQDFRCVFRPQGSSQGFKAEMCIIRFGLGQELCGSSV